MNEKTLNAALDYAERGFPVFPLCWIENGECSCGDLGCGSQGKHPLTRNGFKDATLDINRVRAWWNRHPSANLGMPTGGWCWVLDVDPRHGGIESLVTLERQHGPLPVTAEARTGGGGWHILFAHPGSKVVSRNIVSGLDVKGDGGYIVLAPSGHISGGKYQWIHHPENVELADAPEWLLKLVGERRVAA